jgi:hypothetical protein
MTILKDATGKGYGQKVDRRNHAHTLAIHKRRMSFISEEDEEAYAFTAGPLTVPASECAIAWIKATEANKHLHLERIRVGWNGGSTNGDKVVHVKVYTAAATPTANNTAVTPANLYVTSSHSASVTAYKWDEVSTGMTISSLGTAIEILQGTKGLTEIESLGGIVIPQDGVLAITAEGEEVGECSVSLTFWIEDDGE